MQNNKDVTLLPQEWFSFLISIGMNFEVSNNVRLEMYIKMRHDITEMAADLQQKGMEEEAFVVYNKFLT